MLRKLATNNGDLIDTHAAQLPEEGNTYLTVEELRGLHKSQSLD